MSKLTNEFGIPEVFLDAVRNDPYDKGEADFSATGLIKPPQVARLWEEHGHKISTDVRDEIWKLLGSGVHNILERAGRAVTEERFFAEIGGKTISGQVDSRDGTVLTDYKVSSVYSYQMGLKSDWEQQVNIYAWLCRQNGHEITEASIVVVMRDWMKSRAGQDKYPDAPVKTIEVPMWLDSVVEEFLNERIMLHTQEGTVPCTDEERWARGAWKHKPPKGRSKAYDSMAEAAAAATEKGGGEITSQKPKYVRCEGWCAVSQWCPQWQAHKGADETPT